MEPAAFEALIHQAILEIPKRFRDKLENVAFVVEDHVRQPERQETRIQTQGILLGLYRGVPYGRRGPWYSGVLPDTITLFQDAIEQVAGYNPERIRVLVAETVRHEVGHYFGMNEAEVRKWERGRHRQLKT